MTCINFINIAAIRNQVGTVDVDGNPYDLSDVALLRNCLACSMAPELPPELAPMASIAKFGYSASSIETV